MKKLIASVFAVSLASSAMATLSFDYGATWFQPRFDPDGSTYNWTGVGQGFGVNWDLDNDLILGYYSETTDINNNDGDTYHFQVNAINVSKGVVKNASVGLRLGTFHETYNYESGMLTDIFGAVTLMSGAADKISGSLKATVGGRFADNDWNGGETWNGYFVGVAVGIGI